MLLRTRCVQDVPVFPPLSVCTYACVYIYKIPVYIYMYKSFLCTHILEGFGDFPLPVTVFRFRLNSANPSPKKKGFPGWLPEKISVREFRFRKPYMAKGSENSLRCVFRLKFPAGKWEDICPAGNGKRFPVPQILLRYTHFCCLYNSESQAQTHENKHISEILN